MIVLSSRMAVRHFAEEDLELLVSLASVAALRLRNVQLAEEAAQRRLLEKELELGRRIQMALLPSLLPELPGYRLHGGTRPSRTVSGDYFQVLTRRDGDECVLMIADVSGKGVAASLLTASLEALAAGPLEDGLSPDEVLRAGRPASAPPHPPREVRHRVPGRARYHHRPGQLHQRRAQPRHRRAPRGGTGAPRRHRHTARPAAERLPTAASRWISRRATRC